MRKGHITNMFIAPDYPDLQYSGRIDFDNPSAPVLVYPCSYVRMRFTGTFINAVVENRRAYFSSYLGFIIDGVQDKVKLPDEGKATIGLASGLEDMTHEILLFKRMDACHEFCFCGFEVADGAVISAPEAKPDRRIEVYGDSVSAGEVSEAVDYVGKPDPEHDGEFSNSYYSYSWLTARKLNAEIHDIAQGGIALLHNTGWFAAPEYIGMEEVYDKLRYNTELGEPKAWDFTKYMPHVVIVAIGQNDSNPEDYMASDYEGAKAVHWRSEYKAFIRRLREIYPKAAIILATTILGHNKNWDKAIDQVSHELCDTNVYHFLYTNNGIGTPGHIRIPEAERMSDELAAFIDSLGEGIWQD